MQITFLVGSFHPDFSAVGYCAYQVQKCLTDEFDISVISFRSGSSQPLEERLDAIHVHRIETDDMRARAKALAGAGPKAHARLMALRLKGAARRLLSPVTIDQSLVRAYQARLEEMIPRPEVIVPVVFPFETILAALAFKRAHPEVTVIPYLFDDFVDSGSLHVLKLARTLKRGRHLKLERQMLEQADAVLSMHSLRAHFERYFSPGLREKITYLEHPLLTRHATACAPRQDDGVTRLCYTGALTRGYVEPGHLLDLLRAIPTANPVHADFYVMGNASGMIRTETLKGGIQIVNHGRVPKNEANSAVYAADILLNVGEVQGKQISSKVFEYMANGKPIVHLAYVPDDAVTKILAKYPLALCLVQDQGRFDENVRLLSEFITTRRRDMLTFETAKAIYPEALPGTTATLIATMLRASD